MFAAVMAGAAGYRLKEVGGMDLVRNIRRAGTGASLMDPRLHQRVLNRIRDETTTVDRLSRLTPQERRILDLIADGQTNREIGERLFLAEKTVKNYVSNLLSKLGMQTSNACSQLPDPAERAPGPRNPMECRRDPEHRSVHSDWRGAATSSAVRIRPDAIGATVAHPPPPV